MNAQHDNPISPDDLDRLLTQWHQANSERAQAGRDTLMARIREQAHQGPDQSRARPAPSLAESLAIFAGLVRRALVNRYSPVAAALVALAVIVALLIPGPRGSVRANVCYAPEGGRLDALDDDGNVLGPCALQHTDVQAEISGPFSRVTVRQAYHNEFPRKIEAVYTFPLSHRGAVDRMTMTVGDRVVIGEVHDRDEARRMYDQAKRDNYVASLLEQERPNIFTQSVANIEPGADVVVEISYVEILEPSEGTYRFEFPMVVGPRYVPGAPTGSAAMLPAELSERVGLVLLGPAEVIVGAAGDAREHGTLQGGKLRRIIDTARPIAYPGDRWWGAGDATGGAGQPVLWHRFEADYTDGSKEFGELNTDGTAQLNGRWFYFDPKAIAAMGTGFADDTNQVPDASLMTPQPVKPGERSGQDISVKVSIDTGGPGIAALASPLHEIDRRDQGPSKLTVELAKQAEIPNRDFVLSWKTAGEAISEATFVHTDAQLGEGFFTLVLQPPARVAEAAVPPRELVFVMDVSGSMKGVPIERSKEVMTRAIDAMRSADTFNVVTFSGYTEVLWDEPKPATAENVAAAKGFVDSQRGGGGTEMMKAIEAALSRRSQGPALGLKDPRPGPVVLDVPFRAILQTLTANPAMQSYVIRLGDDRTTPLRLADGVSIPTVFQPEGVTLRITGRWVSEGGSLVLVAESIGPAPGPGAGAAAAAMRIVVFLTDGYVGNDLAIIDAVNRNAATTRVFCFGIGNSVNRFLIDGMARAGRGESEVILLNTDAGDAAERFARRIQTPVLTDIEVAFSEGLAVTGTIPAAGMLPDLFDERPLVIHGRYGTPGTGTLTVRGRTGAGPWERTIPLDLPADAPAHDAISSIWARAKVDEVLAPHLAAVQQGAPPTDIKATIVALGEQYRIMTPYTSFVAVEKSRMTIDGKPVLVSIPIEMPEGVSYAGVFGEHAVMREEPEILGRTRLNALIPAWRQPPGPEMAFPFQRGFGGSGLEGGGGGGGGTGGGGGFADGGIVDSIRGVPIERRLDGQALQAGKRAAPVPAAPPGPAAQPAAQSSPLADEGSKVPDAREKAFAERHRELLSQALEKKAQGDGRATEARIATIQEKEAGESTGADVLNWEDDLAGIENIADRLAEAHSKVTKDDDAGRLERVQRVLDPRLLAIAYGVADKSTAPLRVTVLLVRVDDGVLESLRAAGLTIEGSSRSLKIVVGKIAAGDLEKLAILDVVRRIAATVMVPEKAPA